MYQVFSEIKNLKVFGDIYCETVCGGEKLEILLYCLVFFTVGGWNMMACHLYVLDWLMNVLFKRLIMTITKIFKYFETSLIFSPSENLM